MTKWIPSILAALGAAGAVFVPGAQAFLIAHPAASTAVSLLYAILAHVLPSPMAPQSVSELNQLKK